MITNYTKASRTATAEELHRILKDIKTTTPNPTIGGLIGAFQAAGFSTLQAGMFVRGLGNDGIIKHGKDGSCRWS